MRHEALNVPTGGERPFSVGRRSGLMRLGAARAGNPGEGDKRSLKAGRGEAFESTEGQTAVGIGRLSLVDPVRPI